MNAMTQIASRKEKGFTLIELVMVIVILGILAAFALPRFADLGGEARASTVQGAFGAIKSASAIAHSKCLASANCDSSASGETASLEGGDVDMEFGYPAATADGIQAASQISADDFNVDDSTTPGTFLAQADGATALANCQVSYVAPTAVGETPTITVDVGNC